MSPTFPKVASEVQSALKNFLKTDFSKVASEVKGSLREHRATTDMDAEWQRVNSYIADVLKDAHVLYAKLARLQGDFAGAELDQLQKISESILVLGDELSVFSKDFYEGKYMMQQSEFTYGDKGGAPVPNPNSGQPVQPPPPEDRGDPSLASPESDGQEPPDNDSENYDIPVEVQQGGEEQSQGQQQ